MSSSESKRPEDTAFKQQRLRAWQPLLTPPWVIGTFIVLAIVFIPLGVVILSASNSVVELEQRYDNLAQCATLNQTCLVEMTVSKNMDPPIFFYYKLTNFYQNHRRYVKSRSDEQLRGASLSATANCDPLEEWSGQPLYPCGLIAHSYFNDSFDVNVCKQSICDPLVLQSNWTNKGIAWKTDLDEKFKAQNPHPPAGYTNIGPQGFPLPSVDTEEFVVWMRTAGLPTFKKLHRKIEIPLREGDLLKINVANNYRVSGFDGTKSIVLSTTSWLGGKNEFLAYAFLVVGGLCLLLAIIFLVKHLVSPRLLGDMKYLQWGGPSSVSS
eukprot:TRINITY_DN1686_c0_g1_i1.p1 TRINITY_DN1686_c0_g1~~TRINITY_DN1686_c0_g1_i1.p1  ORF type:complete len:340 (+),score=63.63 TRINITY_DN1686_c0_g1_i1:50-1021(+)